jgi:hypothetical protein
MSVQEKQTAHDRISHLSCEVLFALARNDSALPEFRKAAVGLMLEKGCPQAKSPELILLVDEVRRGQEAKLEVEAIVESAIEQEIPDASIPFTAQSWADGYWEVYHDDDCDGVITPYPENLCLKCGMHPDLQSRGARRTSKPLPASGPFRASVTTATLMQPDVIRNAEALGDDALAETASTFNDKPIAAIQLGTNDILYNPFPDHPKNGEYE